LVIEPAELAALLPAHLARQRWYGAKHRRIVGAEVNAVEVIESGWPGLLRVVAEVESVLPGPGEGNGTDLPHAQSEDEPASACYQLVLGLRPAEEMSAVDVGEDDIVGLLSTDQGQAFCFDGLTDSELSLGLLRHIAPSLEVGTVRAVIAEQSNSSLVYDERAILKIFRRVAGANPDVEVTTALARVGFSHVPEPLAVWRSGGDDLGLVQRYLRGAVEGWALANTSLRDLYDRGGTPESSGGDLGPEATRLGKLTADLHLALAEAFGREVGESKVWADAIVRRISGVTHPDLDSGAAATIARRLAELPNVGASIRVHGDYHLGQVLRTDEGWFVLDFEGEPATPMGERRERSSPLRDVAGMFRSFQYAAWVASAEHGGGVSDLAAAWESHVRDAFLSAYLAKLEGTGLLPEDPGSIRAILSAFEIDKAVYEVAYEQAHRPDWVVVPLEGVRRLINENER
jgi:maltokinase